MSSKWDLRFLRLAKHVAQWSKDPSTKVGAVIADQSNRVVSLGYNGFPRGVEDKPETLLDREAKYLQIVHAEMNAILFTSGPATDTTLYTWPMLCCSRCAAMVINAGISRVVSTYCAEPRWQESIALSIKLFFEAGLKVRIYPPNHPSTEEV